ncbi:MAG: shikimate kinase [Desulfitobacteriaceae bacterium]|nr:shikimate kinase [Desulfitobacteriaceae bacterium]
MDEVLEKRKAGVIMQNIVLIGFMGTGKTAIGRIVARMLNYHFVDTDQMVEEATNLTINQLFRKHGEIRFRSEEALVVKKLAGRERLVIATGGGLVLNPENVKLLKQKGIFVLLTADPKVVLERVSRKNTRPLLAKGKNMETIMSLFKDRSRFYAEYAEFTVDTSHISLEESAEKIVQIVKEQKEQANN